MALVYLDNSLLIAQVITNNYLTPSENGHSFIKDVLPIVAPLLVILTFSIDRVISFRVRKIESKRTWYFKAYFETAIINVDDFFYDVEKIVETGVQSIKTHLTGESDKTLFVGNIIESLSDKKRKFTLEVLSVIQYSYPNLFDNLENILREIEDAGSQVLSSENSSKEDYYKFLSELFHYKANLITALSEPALGKIKKHLRKK